jgi:hypothetical protein
MINTIFLPFIPEPCPDEILGSWLGRIFRSNDSGAWKELLKKSGYVSRRRFSYFDMVDYEENFAILLNALGYNYEAALLQFTTLSYWLTFNASPGIGRVRGTKSIPQLLSLRNERPIASIQSFNDPKSGVIQSAPRMCPECVSCDYQRFGHPYWHRKHQLPNVYFCAEHWSGLISVCGNCGRSCSEFTSTVINAPPIICNCGNRLDIAGPTRPLFNAERRLVEVSCSALQQALPTWDRRHVQAFVREKVTDLSRKKSQYKETLTRNYPVHDTSGSNLLSDQLDREQNRLRFKKRPAHAGAPECCAILAAFSIDLKIAVECFPAMKIADFPNRPPQGPARGKSGISIEISKKNLLAWQKTGSIPYLSANKVDYWNLRINDNEWLTEHFPSTQLGQIPSVESDRKAVLDYIDKQLTRNARKYNLTSITAGVRSHLRDKVWLDSLVSELHLTSISLKKGQGDANQRGMVDSVKAALEHLLESEERPLLITYVMLGSLTKLTAVKVAQLCGADQGLLTRFKQVNNDVVRRRLIWSAARLMEEGKKLSFSAIRHRAGLASSDITRADRTFITDRYTNISAF